MRNYSSLIVNADNGKILHQVNANEARHPASLTKMMTLFLTFEAIRTGRLSMEQRLPVSALAARQPRTNMGLRPGENISVKEAIYSLIVHSANDASVVLGEGIAGNEAKFTHMMNLKAQQLGMKNTKFKNTNGLPHPQQITTAYDIARLALALKRDYKEHYPMFATVSFKFRGREVRTHNNVMLRYPWADGLKTGFVNASGFNIVTSASRPEGKLIVVVMGGPTSKARDDHTISLLEATYKKLGSNRVAQLDSSKSKDIFAIANGDVQEVVLR
jgi:D-alanyl-D-alanine carboxypeptidase